MTFNENNRSKTIDDPEVGINGHIKITIITILNKIKKNMKKVDEYL